ncbi:MAG: TlpA family protein disulfide reductase [Balneolaceae bacterium]|nr:TlpA family protein disulfide reductase [Balneolaceae bacterium]
MMRFQNVSLFPTLLLILSILVVSCSSEDKNKDTQHAQARNELPHDPYSAPLYAASKKTKLADFEAKLLSGETFRLSDQEGKVVLLNIWATWCPPCEEETPDLVDLYEKYRDKGVVFLGISIDEQGASVVKPFVKKYDVTYPITIDDGSIMDKYGPLMGVPTTYIVDAKGNLRYFATGAVTKKEIEPRLEKLINEKSG